MGDFQETELLTRKIQPSPGLIIVGDTVTTVGTVAIEF